MLTEVGKAIKHTAPHVSVVMGIYNCAHTLPKAIESILNQTYDKWELILCDDCSTDNTYSVAQEYAQKDSRIKLLRNTENTGCNIVLNRCIAAAKGSYIAIMDSDDESLPCRLAREAAGQRHSPSICPCSMRSYILRRAGRLWHLTQKRDTLYKRLCIQHSAPTRHLHDTP